MSETKKSEYRLYLEELTQLAKQEVEDKLKMKIRARIYDKDGPPLLRDEYDETDVLFLVYAGQRQVEDEKSIHHLRKATVELFMEAMSETGPNLTIINRLGILVALYEFRKEQPLAEHLANELFGFLSSRLRQPLEKIADLDGIELSLAANALDMWIATNSFSAEPHWPEHTLERIKNLFLYTVEVVGSRPDLSKEQLRLFFLSFQAVLLLQPRWTGREGVLKIIDALSKLNSHSPDVKKRWFRLCRKDGVLLRQNPEWRATFRKGIAELEPCEQLRRPEDALSLLADSLERLGFQEEGVAIREMATSNSPPNEVK